MAQEIDLSHLQKESYDIFLCTRGLPDTLTAETAAVRQLMSALIGSGYRVFFPSALPKETSPEDLAGAMAAAVKTAPVMIAAAIGDEGAQDATARFLWKRYREMSGDDSSRTFLACVRDLSALPEELQGAETLDMGDLEFLVKLTEQLSRVLPKPAPRADAGENDTPEAPEETAPAPEPEPEETAGETAPAPPQGRRKLFLALAIALGVLAVLGLALLIFIK